MPDKDCDECIGDLAGYFKGKIPSEFLQALVGSPDIRESSAETLIACYGSDPVFIALMDRLVDTKASGNDRAWVSAVAEALYHLGLNLGVAEREGVAA